MTSVDVVPAVPAVVVPRWEWRVFSQDHARFRKLRALMTAAPEMAREETYLLSNGSQDNVKIRDNRLEIKHLIRSSEDGLQLWIPVLSATFPLEPADLRAAARALKVEMPTHEVCIRSLSSPRDLEEHFVFTNPLLRAVTVTKQRTRLRHDQCHGELVELLIRNEEWTSVAFEDPNAPSVCATIKHLALETYENTSYPAALKSLLGLPPRDSLPRSEQ